MIIDDSEPWIGLYLPVGFDSASSKANAYSASLGGSIQVLSFYVAWGNADKGPDVQGINQVIENGFIPMITWEPWQAQPWPPVEKPSEQPGFSLSMILKGKYDDYIRNWAYELKKVNLPVFIRPMHEMNGNWYPWCEKANGNQPGEYVKAWSHIRSMFREAQNDRLMWVFSPYAHSVPDQPENRIERFYPGDQEVDWFGLDGYNWGVSQEWSKWQGFHDIFKNSYDCLNKLAPGKPFMISEVGCTEAGGNKGFWIEDTFKDLRQRFSKIKGLVWFNIDKECDWRIESSHESLLSFKKNRKYMKENLSFQFPEIWK